MPHSYQIVHFWTPSFFCTVTLHVRLAVGAVQGIEREEKEKETRSKRRGKRGVSSHLCILESGVGVDAGSPAADHGANRRRERTWRQVEDILNHRDECIDTGAGVASFRPSMDGRNRSPLPHSHLRD